MTLQIQPLRADQTDDARAIVVAGCKEFFGRPPEDFDDMADIKAHYSPPAGTFLVLLDAGHVVGTGGLRCLDDQTCELKRMWFLPAYRGKGYGTKMAESLLEFARKAGYRRVKLDTSPELHAANRLYWRLGFYPVDRYNEGGCTLFMEKQL